MRWMMLALCLIALPVAAKDRPRKVVTIVKIEGASYKVRQRGNEATVARQSVAVNANAIHFARAKRAAEIASGCSVAETYPVFAMLNVILDCSKASAPAEPGVEVSRNE
ncbi:hypothetical protein [Sphingopyxis sp. 550A]|jgi:hypothetical protein